MMVPVIEKISILERHSHPLNPRSGFGGMKFLQNYRGKPPTQDSKSPISGVNIPKQNWIYMLMSSVQNHLVNNVLYTKMVFLGFANTREGCACLLNILPVNMFYKQK